MPSRMVRVLLVFLASVSASCARFILHEKRNESPPSNRQRVASDTLLPMRIGLRENEHARMNAEKWLMEVSSPDSPLFGQHWSQEQVIRTFQPSDETIANVTAWLNSHGIHRFTHSDNKLWFAFDLHASKAEEMYVALSSMCRD